MIKGYFPENLQENLPASNNHIYQNDQNNQRKSSLE
jgi:hypothetical protein